MGKPNISLQQRFHFNGFRIATILLIAWPPVLFAGNLVSGKSQLDWLILPPLQLLAVGIPVWWLVEFARRNLNTGGEKRGWGLFDFSVLITTPTLMIVEGIGLVILIIIFAVWITTQPEMLSQMQDLATRISMVKGDPEELLRLFTPYLENPLVIFSIGALIAGLIPLIEELLKPMGVWLLAGRRITPAEGFVAGAVSGGAFALIESLFYISSPQGEGWWQLAAGRAGTELLHITTAALVGWALALAWRDGSYLRLGLTYLLAVTLHGLWNGLSILAGLGKLPINASSGLNFLGILAQITPYAIGLLVVFLFALLWNSNRVLRAETPGLPIATEPFGLPPTDSSQPS